MPLRDPPCRERVRLHEHEQISLCEALDRVLNKGAVVVGEVTVSVAEVDRLDDWQRATLAIACVSNNSRLVDETLAKVVNLIEADAEALLLDYEIDLMAH